MCSCQRQEHQSTLLYHYRDDSGREVDAVVEAEDGSWGAFEINSSWTVESWGQNLF